MLLDLLNRATFDIAKHAEELCVDHVFPGYLHEALGVLFAKLKNPEKRKKKGEHEKE